MSQKEYLKALNSEIQKLNEVIDRKIIQDMDYRREARRHKTLLTQLRRDEARRKFSISFRALFPVWR
jgi:predicted unusual protein kinase regulating ubiquinone biosynthesis (AarF/ABC1/UbiB family)